MRLRESLSKKQVMYISSNYFLGSSLIILTGLKYAKRDTFICEILAFLAGFLLNIMMYYVTTKFPNMEFTEILDTLFNHTLGKIVAVFYLSYSILLLCLMQTNINGLVATTVMPETPQWIITITMLILSTYVMKLGISTLGLNIELLFPFTFFIISVLYIIIFFNFFNIGNLLPLFTENLTNISKGFLDIFWFPYGDTCFLIFIYSLSKEKPQNFNLVKKIFLSISFLLILRSVIVIFVLGSKEGARILFPLFESVRLIEFGDYIERLDILLLTVWSISSYLKFATTYYVALKCIQYICDLHDYKKLAPALAIFLFPLISNTFKSSDDAFLLSIISVPFEMTLLMLTIIIFLRSIILSYKPKT